MYMSKTFFCSLLLLLCSFGMAVADKTEPVRFVKGEEYELRIWSSRLIYDPTESRPVFRNFTTQEVYRFHVQESGRKKGYLLSIVQEESDSYTLKKNPEDSLSQETEFQNSEITLAGLPGMPEREEGKPFFTVWLSPEYEIADTTVREDLPLLAEAFLMARQAAFCVKDTLVRQDSPHGITFMDDWKTSYRHLVVKIQSSFRFTRVDTRPFTVTCGEVEQHTEVWPKTNTRLIGNLQQAEGVKSIRISYARYFPVYEKKVCTVPVVDGLFEFRLNLKECMPYVQLPGGHALWLEPGDDLRVTLDSPEGRHIRLAGLGAGNNRYFLREGNSWGYGLYRIDRDKMCSRDYYDALDQRRKELESRLGLQKDSLTPAFYRYMMNDFKYRTTYHKLMADQDSTVGPFDCIRHVEICNPLALNVAAYQDVLRHVMYFIMPKRLSELSRAKSDYFSNYERAMALLDGKVLNFYLAVLITDKLKGEFSTGKWLYEKYKRDYLKSPYTEALDEVYRRASRLAPGSEAPDFTLTDEAGDKVSLSDFRGKVVYIDFWGTGCGPCMYEFKEAAPALEEQFKDKEVVFMNISDDKSEKVWRETIAKFGVRGINLIDTRDRKVGKMYMVSGIPHYVLIGKDGKIIDASAPRPSMGVETMIEKALTD